MPNWFGYENSATINYIYAGDSANRRRLSCGVKEVVRLTVPDQHEMMFELHTEKSFLNLVELNEMWIVITIHVWFHVSKFETEFLRVWITSYWLHHVLILNLWQIELLDKKNFYRIRNYLIRKNYSIKIKFIQQKIYIYLIKKSYSIKKNSIR